MTKMQFWLYQSSHYISWCKHEDLLTKTSRGLKLLREIWSYMLTETFLRVRVMPEIFKVDAFWLFWYKLPPSRSFRTVFQDECAQECTI